MTGKFICDVNTGHSPKAEFYKEWSKWFVEEDVEKINEALDEDIEWEMVGDSNISGKEAVREAFFKREEQDTHENELIELHIENILSHGKGVCGWGTMKMSPHKTYRFCDILEFANHKNDAKVKNVIAFVMEISKEDDSKK